MNKKILMIVDYQNDFVKEDGKLCVPGAINIKENIQKLIDKKIFDKKLISFDTHPNKIKYQQTDEYKIYGFDIHCEYKKEGWWLHGIKLPNYEKFKEKISTINNVFQKIEIEDEVYFTKDKFDIWDNQQTFQKYIEQNIDKTDIIYIVGVATNYCVFSNAMGFVKRGYKVKIVSDCVKEIQDDSFEQNMNVMKNRNIEFIASKDVK
jgi:nicotinamidase-related amidase